MAFPPRWSLGSFLSGISQGRRQTTAVHAAPCAVGLPSPPYPILPALSQAQTLAPFIITNSTGWFFPCPTKEGTFVTGVGHFSSLHSPGVCSRSLHKIASPCCREDNNGEWVPKSLKLL